MIISHHHAIYIQFKESIALPIVDGGMNERLVNFHAQADIDLGCKIEVTDSMIIVSIKTEDDKNLQLYFPMNNVASFTIVEPGVLDNWSNKGYIPDYRLVSWVTTLEGLRVSFSPRSILS